MGLRWLWGRVLIPMVTPFVGRESKSKASGNLPVPGEEAYIRARGLVGRSRILWGFQLNSVGPACRQLL